MTLRGDHGKQAEKLALELLKSSGLKLLSKNYHCRYGEIDLVMQDQKTIVFVEVRYRKSSRFGGAIESIDFNKQNRIRLTASHYLQNNKISGNARFDAVLLSSLENPREINWIKSAFE